MRSKKGEYRAQRVCYNVGDVVPGIGKIETNHCGLPWVASIKGELCGVLQIGRVFIDAMTGKPLTRRQMSLRLNNPKYNYENRLSCLKPKFKKGHHTFVGTVYDSSYFLPYSTGKRIEKICCLCDKPRVLVDITTKKIKVHPCRDVTPVFEWGQFFFVPHGLCTCRYEGCTYVPVTTCPIHGMLAIR